MAKCTHAVKAVKVTNEDGEIVAFGYVIKDMECEDGSTTDGILAQDVEGGETDESILAELKDRGVPPSFIIAIAARPIEAVKDELTVTELGDIGVFEHETDDEDEE